MTNSTFRSLAVSNKPFSSAFRSILAILLILLSDIEGLYTKDPHKFSDAKLISEVPAITDEIRSLAGGSGSSLGTGGMHTKIHAAEICNGHGADMIIASGADPDLLYDIMDGKQVGTRFYGRKMTL